MLLMTNDRWALVKIAFTSLQRQANYCLKRDVFARFTQKPGNELNATTATGVLDGATDCTVFEHVLFQALEISFIIESAFFTELWIFDQTTLCVNTIISKYNFLPLYARCCVTSKAYVEVQSTVAYWYQAADESQKHLNWVESSVMRYASHR